MFMTQDEAFAVWQAMEKLDEIGAKLFTVRKDLSGGRYLRIGEDGVGERFYIVRGTYSPEGYLSGNEEKENYSSRYEFAKAYNL